MQAILPREQSLATLPGASPRLPGGMNGSGSLTPELQQEAVALADGFCRSTVECLGADRGDAVYGLVDENGQPVTALSEAHSQLQKAVAYLAARSLATVGIDNQGLTVRLHLERFSEASNWD